ncbi:hypothetical protein CHELA1G11_20700 [Hyphomicrobiales bacterium]|nr:hypothetical protein CHELA1G11_20700 [Hyphomicrobiales bacterium]CAH1691499.1 hypothetical protein CHELA1G2_21015 [Hyphomicrobiales bacterium]
MSIPLWALTREFALQGRTERARAF